MSSHAKPCYNLLSKYSANGWNPIIAPLPAETKPDILTEITPHEFSQSHYMLHKEHERPSSRNNCIGYANYSNIGCGGGGSGWVKSTLDNDFAPGFNEIGLSKFY